MGARFGICPIPERSERKTGQIGAGGGLPEPVVYKVQTTLSNLPSMNFSHIVRPVLSAAFRRVTGAVLLALAEALGPGTCAAATARPTPMPEPGIEVLLGDLPDWLEGRDVGLITNMTGVDRQLRSDIDLLAARADLRLVRLFGPEHGVRGDAQAGMPVTGSRDASTGLPVLSLYGKTREPTAQMLAGLEALLFDIQDIGTRYYTYPSTLALVLRAARRAGIPVVVLDRPNPIGGVHVQGPVLEPDYASFVGMFPIPIRHGMTIGELALLFNTEFGIGADLHVVKMRHWRRVDGDPLPWVPPSPNMPSPRTALVYPGTGLFEGTNISEGRGTTTPFEVIGAPFIDAQALAARMNALGLPGVRLRPVWFTPTFSKYAGQACGGVQIHVLDEDAFQPVLTGVALLQAVHVLYPQQFQFLPGQRPFFDKLAGNGWLRKAIEDGVPLAEIQARWQPGLRHFMEVRKRYLLY